jgi:hypothetical protein
MPHGAPAKTLRRNVLELTTSRPPTCKIVGENRSRPRPDETSVREMDAYRFPDTCKNSLFVEIFSLLICVGNCAESDCGAAVPCYEIGPESPETAKFPVKFPVSRELAWRRAPIRTASPANQSLNYRLLGSESDKCPPIGAFCELAVGLYTPNLHNLGAKSSIVSGLHLKYSRFWETRAGDRARSALRGVGRRQPF